MKRIIVIGSPGSGKSTLSAELGKITALPVCHLDMLYWNADRTTVEKSIFMQRLSEVLHEDEWIIDGNYASSLEMRLAACDTAIFLDYPTQLCIDGIRARRGKPRCDMPWVEREDEEDEELISFVMAYRGESRAEVLRLLQRERDKNIIILKDREETEKFLDSLRKG